MTALNKQALREAAEKALPAMKRLLMMPNDELFDEALLNVDGDVDAANAFNLNFGPETALALLDALEAAENNLIDSECHVAELEEYLRDKQALLEAAEKRIAELRDWNAGLAQESFTYQQKVAELEAREFKVEMPESFYPDGDIEAPLVLQEHEVISAIVASGGVPIAICRRCKSVLDLSHRPDGYHYCHAPAAGIGVKQQQDSVDSDVGSRNRPGMVVAVHIGAGDFVKVKGQVFEVEETDFDDHDVTLWFVGGNALKCAAGCQVEVVAAPVDAGIGVKGE